MYHRSDCALLEGMNVKPIAALALAGALFAACTPASDGTASDSGTPTSTSAKSKAPTKPKPHYTVAQQQAIKSAQNYLSMGSGFSKAGLIEQLSSKAGEGFKRADAVFAVNHVKVDWNAQAVESAKNYMDMGGFSRASLIEQLSSKAGDQFTHAQAVYAANKVGL
jgi:hypothetical protein